MVCWGGDCKPYQGIFLHENKAAYDTFFAGLAGCFGTNQLTLLLDHNPLTVRQFKQSLMEQYAEHQSLLQVSFKACNQAYAENDDTIRAEDELELLPPISEAR